MNTMSLWRPLALSAALALAGAAAQAQAQDLKVGYVNSERVLREAAQRR